MKDISILILTCQAYSDMWSNTLSSIDKNWVDKDTKIILASDDEEGLFDLKHVNVLNKFEGDMSSRFLSAIESIDTPYIFLTFDDYYFSKNIDKERFEKLFSYMKDNNISYCGFFDNYPKGRKYSFEDLKLIDLDLKHPYEINYYPSIWKKEDLLQSLKKGEDIWLSEAMVTKRFRINNKKAIVVRNKDFIQFIDIVRKGKYIRKSYRYMKKHNLFISDRKVRTIKEETSEKIRRTLAFYCPKPIKRFLQKRYMKSGHVVYSDYFYNENYN